MMMITCPEEEDFKPASVGGGSLKDIPLTPGLFLAHNTKGEIIRVGCAWELRSGIMTDRKETRVNDYSFWEAPQELSGQALVGLKLIASEMLQTLEYQEKISHKLTNRQFFL